MTAIHSDTSTSHPPRSDLLTASIPLSKLVPWKGNVRRTDPDAQVEELAASIAAHGLLQPLVVRAAKDKFEIVAGRRRFLALKLLRSRGQLDADHAVSCQVLDPDAEADEISLAENVVRVAMHPADQYEAFSKLAGIMSAAAIAVRFGVSESTVKKRLALGRVSPRLLQAYRSDEMSLEQLAAFTVTNDHVEQERVWIAVKGTYHAHTHSIRRLLTEADVCATDKRVRFVTLAAYEQSGGEVRRDLFTEDESGAYVIDVPLLERLTAQKLADAAVAVHHERWKWVECRTDFDYDARADFDYMRAQPVPPSVEEQAEIERLREALDALSESDDADAWEQAQSLETRIDALSDKGVFTDDQKAVSGAVVTLSHDGDLFVVRGLIRREDLPRGETEVTACQKKLNGKAGLSAALVEALTMHKTAIIAAELINRSDIALATVVHSLLLPLLRFSHDTHRFESCARISVAGCDLSAAEGSTASESIERARRKWMKRFPENADALWPWCLKQKPERLLDLLAFAVAHTVDAVRHKPDARDDSRLVHADTLAHALEIDMAKWFRPTAENFFGRVGKATIFSAFTEATDKAVPSAWNSMKKADLAQAAERELGTSTQWLPEPMRIATRETDGEAESSEDAAA